MIEQSYMAEGNVGQRLVDGYELLNDDPRMDEATREYCGLEPEEADDSDGELGARCLNPIDGCWDPMLLLVMNEKLDKERENPTELFAGEDTK